MKNSVENRKKLVGVIANAWLSSEYKSNLIENPRKVITDAGVDIDGDYEIVVAQDNKSQSNIVIDTEPLPAHIAIEVKDLPPNPNFYQASAYIYHRCATDKVYRTHFIHNAESCFEDIGFYLPEGHNIVVKENAPDKKYFVLPVKPKASIQTESLQNEVAMFATAPVNANANINANANVNVNGDVNVNGAVQVNVVAAGAVVVAVAVLI
ncbi:MAG: nitrile hydratase subunit alpha [Crocinitomicaceae bacterium]